MLLEDGILKATPAFSYLCLMLDIVHDKGQSNHNYLIKLNIASGY